MASPLSVTRNNYHENPKKSDIQTPHWLCDKVFEMFRDWGFEVLEKKGRIRILEPSVGDGNFLQPWFQEWDYLVSVESYEIKEGKDFLSVDILEEIPDIVLCNPPFNIGGGRELAPFTFLKKIFALTGFDKNIPVVLITPHGLRLNQRCKNRGRGNRECLTASSRVREIVEWEKESGMSISSIASIPLDAFGGVSFHAEVLFWNAPFLKPHSWLYPEQSLSSS